MKIALASDHGGFELKASLKQALLDRRLTVEDLGCHDKTSVDYPDYVLPVVSAVSAGSADQGILICTTGVGMSIAANKYPGIRAALCTSPLMARMARAHNDANVLVLGQSNAPADAALRILDEWLRTSFSGEARHVRRLLKIRQRVEAFSAISAIRETDPEVFESIGAEIARQQDNIDLIASENYASPAVLQAQGSVMTNKYAEGYPGRRWYQGCEQMDRVEQLAIDRAKALFGAEHANVQPHSGSSANMAVYFAVLQPRDRILAMSLAHGGHLTHGLPANFSGRFFEIYSYGVDRSTEQIDYDDVRQQALEKKPKLIVAGASSYPRVIDFKCFREIADSVGAYLMVDMAHIGGLVAAGVHPSPVPYCDFVTTTTHKTLRGPRSGMILCRSKFAAQIDHQVFPGEQGGPMMHAIAAKAICLHEAMQPAFGDYQRQIVRNAKALAGALAGKGLRLVSGGTDNHLMLVDLTSISMTGRDAAALLERVGITTNKNVIPFETRSPLVTSGVRLGTPAATTRGMKEPEMELLGDLIWDTLRHADDAARLAANRRRVSELAAAFPVP